MTDPHVTELPAAPLYLLEEIPRATTAALRPFVYAICLARGAVSVSDVVTAAYNFFSPLDNKLFCEGEDGQVDKTYLEILSAVVLTEMVDRGSLKFHTEKKLFVMNPEGQGHWLSVATTLDSALPTHFIADLRSLYYRPALTSLPTCAHDHTTL